MDDNDMTEKVLGSNLYGFITSERNIYRAIYALESYIDEPYLLDDEDLKKLYELSDKFNWPKINKTIVECKSRLKTIFTHPDNLFKVKVFFALKKFDVDNERIKYRPLHTANLIDIICMVAILQILMFEDEDEKKLDAKNGTEYSSRNLSDLSKSIPDNFYGNKASKSVDRIFERWQKNYQKYNKLVAESCHRFSNSHKYEYEISLDIKNFFPSISPFYIWSKICRELHERFSNAEDYLTLKIGVAKLLFLEIHEKSLNAVTNESFGYYDDYSTMERKNVLLAKGVAQGLPQSYFFGNLCMTDVRRIIMNQPTIKGIDYFYVDDSVIYVTKDFNKPKFIETIKSINKDISDHIDKLCQPDKLKEESILAPEYIDFQTPCHIKYLVEFYTDEKSNITHIDKADFSNTIGIEGLPRANSGTSLFNLDNMDDYVSQLKMHSLKEYVDQMIKECEGKINEQMLQNDPK